MIISKDLEGSRFTVIHKVPGEQSGLRLDSFLKSYYTRLSRARLQRSIEEGRVVLRRRGALQVGVPKASTTLLEGDEISVVSEKGQEPEVRLDFSVLHEDEDLLVVDKPPNLPVHPAGSYFFNTLLVQLKLRGRPDLGIPAEREYFLPHRIDKETSGVLVLAKNREACQEIVRQFAARETRKTYVALVKGAPPEEFFADFPLARDPKSRIRLKMAVVPVERGGQEARTGFRALRRGGGFACVECQPQTGRQHQIRVHLSTLGFPIVGDKLYGLGEGDAIRFFSRDRPTPETEAKLLLPRHALHAAALELKHPRSGERMRFEAPLPGDLREFLETRLEVQHATHSTFTS